MTSPISEDLLGWYTQNARRLPWRGAGDPYAVWVSEMMLQQTRVETVIPYYARWMERFPNLRALAEASEQDVLLLWEGLGYYSRARNFLRAAQKVVRDYNGQIPQSAGELQRLPGIGKYTAGAIASIAFGQDEAALDGNIRRVLARLFDVQQPAKSPQGEKILWDLARQVIPPGRSGDFNQALMDLGTAICTPQEPRCLICPLLKHCQAAALGVQSERPVLEKPAPIPHYIVTAAIIRRGEQLLITHRPTQGLLGGLWEFPGGKQEDGESLPECLVREIREELGVKIEVGEKLGVFRHAYTHFKVTLHAYFCTLSEGEPRALHASELAWVTAFQLENYPMGKIDRQISVCLLSQN